MRFDSGGQKQNGYQELSLEASLKNISPYDLPMQPTQVAQGQQPVMDYPAQQSPYLQQQLPPVQEQQSAINQQMPQAQQNQPFQQLQQSPQPQQAQNFGQQYQPMAQAPLSQLNVQQQQPMAYSGIPQGSAQQQIPPQQPAMQPSQQFQNQFAQNLQNSPSLNQQPNLMQQPEFAKALSKADRKRQQEDILIRYVKEMLTPEESKDLIYYNSMSATISLAYMFLWVPATFMWYARYRQDRIANGHLRFRIITTHMIQLPLLLWAQSKRDKALDDLSRKYMNDLSDYEIQNFDQLFHQLKARQNPQGLQNFSQQLQPAAISNPQLQQVAQQPPQFKQQ